MLCILHFESTNIFFKYLFFVFFELSTILHLSADSRNDNKVHKKLMKLLRSYEYTQLYGVSVAVDKTLISAYIKLYKCTHWAKHWSSKMSTHTLHTNILLSKERIKIV